jgi:hypothetical protein
MKIFKLLFISVFICIISLISCTNDDVEKLPTPVESAAMQTALTHLRALYNEDGTINGEMNPTGNMLFDFCFEFVYPIELIYNNGATVTINSIEELAEVLINGTEELYIVGIEFPFNVRIFNPNTNEVEIEVITNEEEFIQLLLSCFFEDPCICNEEYEPVCVEIQENGQTIVITFPNACYAECEGFSENQYFDCDIIDDCGCTEEYEPVCVVSPNGELIEFDNQCIAICEGYTPNDFTDCENNNSCEISELEITVGECNDDNTYTITIDFEYQYTGNDENFDVFTRNFVYLGSYSLSDLPITINNFELSGFDYDYINVCIESNILECCAETEWLAPDCEQNEECEISNLEVVVGECNNDGTYSITIDFEYQNTENAQIFDVFVRDSVHIGVYSLYNLPITINNFELSGFDYDYINVCIQSNNQTCCAETDWLAPDCENNEDCYEYVFPIQMIDNYGTTVNIDSNEEVDYYLDLGYTLVYPIELLINNNIIVVYQGILEGAYGERCD